MSAKKQKLKQRRRARKLADEAWKAVDEENITLAVKLIDRAVHTQISNPALWNEQGQLLALSGDDEKAAESYQAALSLAPDFADAYAHLAAIRVRQGRLQEAVAAQMQAVKHAPQRGDYASRLESYQALVGQLPASTSGATPRETTDDLPHAPPAVNVAPWRSKLKDLDWQEIDDELTRTGCVLIARLLSPETCAQLREFFNEDARFAKTVTMDKARFGQGVYRYFRNPLPEMVDQLRRDVYPNLAPIANRWRQLLDEDDRFPDQWTDFRDRCAAAGQTTPTPLLVKYGPGGFNALHCDVRGKFFFPIQMAVVLSPRATKGRDGFSGGDFLFCDVPERKASDRRCVSASLGDAVLFCTRHRLVSINGIYGLKTVKHGADRITDGTRFVLGVPFHEYE